MGNAQGKIVEIGNRKLVIQSQIKSSGKDHTLFLANDSHGQRFVIKRTVVKKGLTDVVARVKWEADLYQNLPSHKNVLTCHGLKRFIDKDGNSQSLLIFEFCSGGSLKQLMTRRGCSLPVPESMQVLRNISSALLFLHTRDPPIVHLGLRIDNMFLHSNGEWTLGDFTCSASAPIRCSGSDDLRKFEHLIDIPKPYRSPEILNIRQSRLVDTSADIWALGVVFYFMLFAKFPFDSDKTAILLGKYDIPEAPAYEKPVLDLLENLLTVNPESRIGTKNLHRCVSELYEHYRIMHGNGSSSSLKKPHDTALTHFWGHSFPLTVDPPEDVDLSGSANPSYQRIVAEVSSWTQKAAALKLVPPKAKYVRRMVILAWERQEVAPSDLLPGMFQCLFRQPIFSNGVSAYKALQIVHKLMQEGPPAFTNEALKHRSLLLTVAERWHSQQADVDPWVSQVLVAYAHVLEQRLLFLRDSFIFECNFSISSYLARARVGHYSGFRVDVWFSRCIDVAQRMLEFGLQLISCGFFSMGVSGIGPSKQHLFFRETILVPILDDLFGIFSAVTFLLGIATDCSKIHRTNLDDTTRLYQSFFSRFHALLLRASKSDLVATFQRLPELPRELPELSMNNSIYPPQSNVPAYTPHNIEYCEELRSQFVIQLEMLSKHSRNASKSRNDSRSATAPVVHSNETCKDAHLQNIFEEFTLPQKFDTPVTVTNVPVLSSSSPASPSSTVTRRNRSWAEPGKHSRPRIKSPSDFVWDSSEFGWQSTDLVEWAPVRSSVSGMSSNINIPALLAGKPSPSSAQPSTVNDKTLPEMLFLEQKKPQVNSFSGELEITVTKDDDIDNPFAIIEKSIKAQKTATASYMSKAISSHPSLSPNESELSNDEDQTNSVSIMSKEDEISLDEVKIGERIGIGGFAEVYKGEWRGTDVAIKKLLMQRTSAGSLREFRKEVVLLRSLRHPNVVMFMGACTVPPSLFMVTELLQMSLFDLLHNTDVKLNWKLRLKMALDTANGINFLHHSHVIHRDLKSANLLLDKHYGVKVSDFGLSRIKAQHCTMTGQCGTFQWMAPEVISNEKYTEKADVYSFGIILWEIVARKVPFEAMNGVQVSVAVATQQLRPKMPEDVPNDIRELIENCWSNNPALRPAFSDIVQRLKAIQQSDFVNL
uniref:non-specific serine/threonine protein kinase n=1 Tax=Spongospora subterranea TaxID=70186 RepID=A0A0H5RDA8_9EUKA|eukprot:CRZ06524.1 hypothetical protein [Spongospora subterranea]